MPQVLGCLGSAGSTPQEPCKDGGEKQQEGGQRACSFAYTFMIFRAITSFLRIETSSSCFFFSLCRNWM